MRITATAIGATTRSIRWCAATPRARPTLSRCAAALIAQPGYGADADRHDIFAAAPGVRHAWRLDGGATFAPDAAGREAQPNADPNRTSYLAFTSGTTGTPKGVMHSDNTLLANA